jgi:hypothetical protein
MSIAVSYADCPGFGSICWRNFMRKGIICITIFLPGIFKIYLQEEPLVLPMYIGDEILASGNIIIPAYSLH